jgi:hypothetical protein
LLCKVLFDLNQAVFMFIVIMSILHQKIDLCVAVNLLDFNLLLLNRFNLIDLNFLISNPLARISKIISNGFLFDHLDLLIICLLVWSRLCLLNNYGLNLLRFALFTYLLVGIRLFLLDNHGLNFLRLPSWIFISIFFYTLSSTLSVFIVALLALKIIIVVWVSSFFDNIVFFYFLFEFFFYG